MSIELRRTAHFSGKGLPAPVEVWFGEVEPFTEVYFTQSYDRSHPVVPTVAMTATLHNTYSGWQRYYEFEMPERGELTPQLRAMLLNAALYSIDLSHWSDSKQVEEHEGGTGEILRRFQISRARYLPQPFEDPR